MLKEAEFLAGAPAPPRTALRTLASQDRCRRQNDQRTFEYTVQSRAEALGPAHQVQLLE